MINHARTLLLNIHPKRADYSDVGESAYEYIPTDFVPVRLSAPLLSVRKILFGSNPDALFCGFRANELLAYIHETEFAEYIYALDKRVTYWPEKKDSLYKHYKPKIVVTQIVGEPKRLLTAGVFQPSAITGTSYRNYVVLLTQETTGNQNFFVRIKTLEAPHTETTLQSPVLPARPIALPHNDVTVRFSEGTIQADRDYLVTENEENVVIEYFVQPGANIILERPTDVVPISADSENVIGRWEVATQSRPVDVITTLIPTLEMLGEPVFLELFGVNPEEPYATFRNLWFNHPLTVYRLIGLTLAVIYRTEEARNG